MDIALADGGSWREFATLWGEISYNLPMNTLYYGDNLPILRSMASESVDLVYLDPPFNSNRSYNVLFKNESGISSDAQITAFDDTWHWGQSAEQAYADLIRQNPGTVDDMIAALRRIIGENQMLAYLVMMAARLVELQRVLKPTGSLYLHCDPTASHYLKIILDTVFGFQNYRNEIIWIRTSAHANVSQKFGAIHDILFFYSKTDGFIWNQQHLPYGEEYLETFFDQQDESGRRYARRDLTASMQRASKGQIYTWKGITPPPSRCWAMTKERMDDLEAQGKIHWPIKEGGMPRLKLYPEDLPGNPIQDVWTDIPPMHNLSAERLGYPTQKPLALLERIIQASSNPGDIVLDPFCGCGTAIAAAEKLGRHWIGIDITYLSINLIENRMKRMFPGLQFEVVGKPKDLASARNLAECDRYQFQWWALSLVGAKPLGGNELGGKGKKGSDKGIDGVINYIDSARQDLKRVLVQVKSGHVNPNTVRDLRGVLQREQAEIGVLVSLEPPTRDMLTEAASAGVYRSEFWDKSYPRLQILTIEQLLGGEQVKMPPETGTFMAAQKVKKEEGRQGRFEID